MRQRRIASMAEYVRTMPKILRSYKQLFSQTNLKGAAMKAKRTWSAPTLVIHGKVEEVTHQRGPCWMGKQGGKGDVHALTLSDCHH